MPKQQANRDCSRRAITNAGSEVGDQEMEMETQEFPQSQITRRSIAGQGLNVE